jgi:hypothetical protein
MTRRLLSALCLACWLPAAPANAQATERIGPRAPGMGGAFVAVADDSSAVWWNPGGLAAGAFFDLSITKGGQVAGLSAGVPPFGLSYYQFSGAIHPTAGPAADREERRAMDPLRASQAGITLVQSLVDGVHVGATLRVARGERLDGGTGTTGDLDVGVHAVLPGRFQAFRLGAVVRNARAPIAGDVWFDRVIRAGVAFDADRAGYGPAIVSLDVDLREYEADAGRRQVIAGGAERWFGARRAAVRGGARMNVAAGGGAAATAGASVALRAGFYVDGHAAFGGETERGWGVAGRVSF